MAAVESRGAPASGSGGTTAFDRGDNKGVSRNARTVHAARLLNVSSYGRVG